MTTTTMLTVAVPVVFILAAPLLRAYLKIRYPAPRALGRVLPKLCIVASDEILRYNELLDEELKSQPHMRRTLRRNQIRINWSYLGQMAWNTILFQQVVRFEAMKIDPGKSSFDYDSRETLILDLVDESAELRWDVVKAQASLLTRAIFGITIQQEALMKLLGHYKQLEQEIIVLAGMAEDTCYRDLLIERLGLTNWRIIEGGAEPA